jgi:phospholipid-binding lipoprotein MlaA
VRRLSAQWWRWTPAVVLVTAILHLTPVCGADAPPPPLPEDVPRAETVAQAGDLHVAEHPPDAGPFEIWDAGPTDANIPPEAFRLLAEQPGLSLAEFAQALSSDLSGDEEEFEEEIPEYDPWESFNRKMFAFNQNLDRYVLKPVARVWNFVVPELAQQSLANAFDNIAMPRRLINNLLQLKMEGAGRELARFFLNTSMGVGGFFDVATELGVPRSDADTGQTLGRYGVGPGPYLVLPFLPPLTVRDGFGYAADGAMQPLSYVAPFEATVGMRGGQVVNDRSLNLESFEQLERMTFDLYSAVRNAYLQRRQRMIQE